MKIDVLVKYAKPKKKEITEEDQEEIKTRNLLKKLNIRSANDDDDEGEKSFPEQLADLFNPQNMDFYYKPYVVDLNTIKDFYPMDNDHVVLVTKNSGDLPIKAKWDKWKITWQTLTGELITTIRENNENE